jgi:hypothetical protein
MRGDVNARSVDGIRGQLLRVTDQGHGGVHSRALPNASLRAKARLLIAL